MKIASTDKDKLVQQKTLWNNAGYHTDISYSCESND